MSSPAASSLASNPADAGRDAPPCTPARQGSPHQGRPIALALGWLIVGAGLSLVALSLLHGRSTLTITDYFFLRQDLPVLLASALMLLAMLAAASLAPALPVVAWPTDQRSARIAVGVASLGVLAIGWIGWRVVCQSYPLSMDEFMAVFDATSFHRGQLIAAVPAAWRDFVPAMQPYFGIEVPGHAVWSSNYLPLNAALRALFMSLGDGSLAGAVLSAVSVLLTFDIARRLWPDRPDAAVAAALMLASSSQLLITGMTPYAMPAHLALNLLWLRLYLQRRAWADAAALAVGWAACGLHQLVFHLVFVAPFVLGLLVSRSWRRAAAFTAGYGAICLFWLLYRPLVFHFLGLAPPQGQSAGLASYAALVLQLLRNLHPLSALRLMAENLLRFVTWQNPLMAALLLIGLLPALRCGGIQRRLAASIGLTVIVVALVMPYQGHGWGYRYLHGLLGSACLIAAGAYARLAQTGWPRGVAPRALMLSVAASLLVLAPLRAWQVRAFTAPYARAHQAIAASHADFVVVDGRGLAFADDLVRNDPGLQVRPLLFDAALLPSPKLAALCQRGRVTIFDQQDGRGFGIKPAGRPLTAATRDRLDVRARAAGCAASHVAQSGS
jgi:hypothetical protein